MVSRKKKDNPFGIDSNDPFGFGRSSKSLKPGKNPFGINPNDPFGFGSSRDSRSDKNMFGFNPDDPFGFGGSKKGNGPKVRVPVPIKTQKQLFIRCEGNCEKCEDSLRGLTAHIHHKNGDPSDNRMSNLIVLCPNCHGRIH
jgi:hypothetical protein